MLQNNNENSITYTTKQIENNYFSLKKRYVGLDVFRIVSMISICAFHTTIHLGAHYGMFHAVSQMGAVFMTAFFMISGYSLFVNYANYNITRIDVLEKYFLKRIIGIIPMYYVVAVLFVIFSFATACMSGGGLFFSE